MISHNPNPIHSLLRPNLPGLAVQIFKWDTSINGCMEYHSHEFDELLIFIKGGGSHHIESNTYDIEGKTIHFVPSGKLHLLKRTPQSRGFTLAMSTEMFREESKLWTHWPVGKYHSNIFVQLIETAEILFKISKTYDDANQFQFDKFLTLTREKKIVTSHETSIKHRTSLHAVQFTEYLENVVSIHTRVSKIAKALNVSAKYLTEICHREFQLPPSVLVRDAIIRKAKKLLKETDKPIKEIAEDLGFVDTAHFCRTFKKVSGFRPGDFR